MTDKANERSNSIIRYNMIGIIMNLFLACSKMLVGQISNAQAIYLDGINSFADMMSSVISIFTTRIGKRNSDVAHPFGYGRIEYLSSLAVTMFIMYIGVTTIVEAIEKIIHKGDPPVYNITAIVVVCISMICKTMYGIVMRRNGKKLDSIAMVMTGTDSLGDGLVSFSILIAIIIHKVTGIDIQYYLCIAVSAMIIHSAVSMTLDCVKKILGTRIDNETTKKIKNMIITMPEVLNVSNLVIHSYGEARLVGSVDISVDGKLNAAQISKLSRRIIRQARDLGVMITSVGISGTNVREPKAVEIWDKIIEVATQHECIKRIHSFTIDFEDKEMSFYVVPDFSIKQREDALNGFLEEIRFIFPDMNVDIEIGIDM